MTRKRGKSLFKKFLSGPFALLILSAYLFFCLVQIEQADDQMLGWLGGYIGNLLSGALGITAWLLPIVTGYLSLRRIRGHRRNFERDLKLMALVVIGASLAGSGGFGGLIGNSVWIILSSILGTFISIFLLFVFSLFCISSKIFKKLSLSLLAKFKRLLAYVSEQFTSLRSGRRKKNNGNVRSRNGASRDTEFNNFATSASARAEQIAGLNKTNFTNNKYLGLLPETKLLDELNQGVADDAEVSSASEKLVKAFSHFQVDADLIETVPGPMVLTHFVAPKKATKISGLEKFMPDISRFLGYPEGAIRLNLDIFGREGNLGIEVPSSNRKIIGLRSLIESTAAETESMTLPLRVGADVMGSPLCADLAEMPHLLLAGSTKSGKSVAMRSLLVSLLLQASPATLRLVLIDPKKVEFSSFRGAPHLLGGIISESDKAAEILNFLTQLMEERYTLLAENDVTNIGELAEKKGAAGKIPSVVVAIDELADLLMQEKKKVEDPIIRLAQKARAAGIHLILATQRPTANILTGTIKTNVPARLAFRVSSRVDSHVILDEGGAESLLGQGDGFFLNPGVSGLTRFQAPFVTLQDIGRVVDFWKQI